MQVKFLTATLAAVLCTALGQAGPVRDRIQERRNPPPATFSSQTQTRSAQSLTVTPAGTVATSSYSTATQTQVTFGGGAVDALDEVNAARAARGLPPFLRDEALTHGALQAARFRAQMRLEGHTMNDFQFLPPGANAGASGCAAWHPTLGWGACATYESYRSAGAAWSYGADGRRYMHLFVR